MRSRQNCEHLSHRPAVTSPTSGQALVEFALVIPLLFLLLVNAVNFGGFLFAWITVANAARTGAQYFTGAGAAAGAPAAPTAAQVSTLVTTDISSLLNRSSLIVRACTNNNNVVSCSGAGSSLPPADPEPSAYVSATVDVSYTYQPFIPLFDFTKMAVHASLPGSTIHSRGMMRVAQ
jgi:Flp pilus assembly protein TadG